MVESSKVGVGLSGNGGSISGVWVIDSSGLPLARSTYRSFDLDESLISGFLSAISSFGSSVVSAGDLHSLRFGLMNLVLSHGNPLVAVAGDASENELDLYRIGRKVREEFLNRYGHVYPGQGAEGPSFLSFDDFSNVIDRIVGMEHSGEDKRLQSHVSQETDATDITRTLRELASGNETSLGAAERIAGILKSVPGISHRRVVETISALESANDMPRSLSEVLQGIEDRMNNLSLRERIAQSLVRGIAKAMSRREKNT